MRHVREGLACLRDQRGAVMVLAAGALTALLSMAALAVDVGVLYLNKTQLQNAVDAAALAGVQELPTSSSLAVSSASQYAALNGKAADAATATVLGSDRVKVTATRPVALFFARVFGQNEATVGATATAKIDPASGASGIVPFGLAMNQTFDFGTTYTLKLGGGDGYAGNFQALSLGGTGADQYRENIKKGYDGIVRIGDWILTETGNMVGPTKDGVSYRVDADPAATYDAVQEGSSRIIVVPLLESLEVNGRKDVRVKGFAAFFLESMTGQVVTGKFLHLVVAGEIGGGATDYGVYAAGLIE